MTPEEYEVIRGLGFDEAMLVYGDVWDTQHWPTIGDLGKFDRYFLLVWLLNRPDAAREWVFDRCRELDASPDDHLDLWAREHYKDLCLKTHILTPDGWVRHGDLRVGGHVFAPDGTPTEIIDMSPVFTDSECYEVVFDDGARITAGAHHLWVVETCTRKRIPMAYNKPGPKRVGRETLTLSTRELLTRLDAKHPPGVRLAQPPEFPEADLPVDPYTLGAWLGDGDSSAGAICGIDEEVFESVAAAGFKISARKKIRSTVYGLVTQLKAVGVHGNKHIPEIYQRASIAQRRALLQGLMDTDGHCSTRGTATFCNTNARLADDVEELITSLGMVAHKRLVNTTYKGKPYQFFQVSFQAYKDNPPFRIARKLARCKETKPFGMRYIVSITPAETVPTQCISVAHPSGCYLAGRSLVPTHNSSAGTMAGIIQAVVRDPEITIGIFSHNNVTAKSFLNQIKNEFEGNDRLKMAYPGVFYDNPQRESPSWSEDKGIVVRRKGNPKEPTVGAHGLVDGMPVGMHYALRVYDDVVTQYSVTTPDQMTKTFDAWGMSLFLGKDGGRQWHFGTRYHFGDAYGKILDTGSVKPRIYPATEDGTPSGKPVLFSQAYLDQKRMAGPYIFSCQMLLDPVADEAQGFKREWLKYWAGSDGGGMNRYIVVDPANERKKNSDYTAAFVIGVGEDRNYYVLDMVRDRLNLTGRADMLFSLHKRWKPHGVGYEKYGKDSDIQHYEDRMERENYRFSITELGGRTSKNDRIRKLVPLFEQGRVYMPEACFRMSAGKNQDIMRVFVEQEYLAFPAGVHDDMLDCLARIVDPDMNVIAPESSAPRERDGYETKRKRSGSWMAA